MSPKAKATSNKKEKKAAPAKPEKKSPKVKAAPVVETEIIVEAETPAIDPDELEEREEAAGRKAAGRNA